MNVQCKACDRKQPESDVCTRCGRSLPTNVVEVEKIIEIVVEKIVELRDTITVEREIPKYFCPHAICPLCDGKEIELPTIDDAEKSLIIARIAHFQGSRMEACASLNIGKTTLYRKLKQYGIGRVSA